MHLSKHMCRKICFRADIQRRGSILTWIVILSVYGADTIAEVELISWFMKSIIGFLNHSYLHRIISTFLRRKTRFESVQRTGTEDPPKPFKREYIWAFFRKFRVVSVCFALLWNSSVCFVCFNIGSQHRNKPKFLVFGFTKQTETNAKQILFRFVSVRTEIYFCLFRGHPIPTTSCVK
jgi:hypothetical protein